jgi:hypothetical protein
MAANRGAPITIQLHPEEIVSFYFWDKALCALRKIQVTWHWLLCAWHRDEASRFASLSTELSAVVDKLFSKTLWHPTARMRLIQFLFHTYGVDEVAAAIKAKRDTIQVNTSN